MAHEREPGAKAAPEVARPASHGPSTEQAIHQERLAFALDSANAGLWEWDLRTQENFWSERVWELYGLEAGSCAASYDAWAATVHPGDLPEVERAVGEAARTGGTFTIEWRVRQPPGAKARWLMSRGGPLRSPGGEVARFGGLVLDITAQKEAEAERARAEASLRVSHAKLEAALDSMADAVFISDAAGNFVDFNDAFATFHRFRSKAECARTLAEYPDLLDVYLPDGTRLPLEQWAVPRALRGERVANAEYGLRRKDTGEEWTGSYAFGPIRDAAGAITGAVVVARDITESKRVQARLAAETERLAVTLRSIGDAVLATDARGRITMLNPVAEELTGWTGPEALGLPVQEVFAIASQETGAPLESPTARVLREGVVIGLANHTVLRSRDGAVRPIADSAAPIRDGDGRMIGTVLVFRDQTREREQERALRESEEKYRGLVEQSLAGIYIIQEGQFRYANPRFAEMFGYATPEELMACAGFGDVVAPEDRAEVSARVKARIAAGVSAGFRFRGLRRDGGRIDVEGQGRAFSYQGKPASLGVMLDVSERTRALEAEARSASRYQQLFENLIHGFAWCRAICDERGRTCDWTYLATNAAWSRMSGVADPVGRRLTELMPGFREAMPALIERVGKVAATGRPDAYELDVKPLGKWLEVSAYSPAPGEFVTIFNDITSRKQAEQALHRSEARFRALIEKQSDMVFLYDAAFRVRFASPAATAVLGWSQEELLGREALGLLHDDVRSGVVESLSALRDRPRAAMTLRGRILHKNGSWRLIEGTVTNLLQDPEVAAVVGNLRDITDHRALEEQYLQAQKLESVGRLAGGVAHDFNNILAVILSNVEELRGSPRPAPSHADELAAEVGDAALRARDLTRQLLAFARKQVIAPVALDVNKVIASSEKLLRRMLGEDVALRCVLREGLWPARCDPSQLEQVLLNLAVNARDAMPRGGGLTLETSVFAEGDPAAARYPGLVPGDYVQLAVTDTGFGMNPEIRARLFEPFFTTKEVGKGSGLGLATVHGIVRQSGGFICCESEEGKGSTFFVCLPRAAAHAGASPPAAPATPPRGSETILLVEDDPHVRRVSLRALEAAGYRVRTANDGLAALTLIEAGDSQVDLVVTDVVMPGLDGGALAARLQAKRPGLRVLFVSGYTDDAISQHGVLPAGTDFMHKPFTGRDLLARVRAALDRSR